MPVIDRDEGRYVARYRDENGELRDKSFGRGEEARLAAENWCQQWEKYHEEVRIYQLQQQMKAAESQEDSQQQEEIVTLSMLIEEYLVHSKENGCSQNHYDTMKWVGEGIFCEQLGADTPIKDIDYAKDVLPFMSWLKNTPTEKGTLRTVVTCNKYGNFLKTFFNYAVKRGYLETNPMALWSKQYVERVERLLTTEDVEKILEHSPDHLQWAIEVAFYTGVRTGESELLSLKWSDVDYEKKLLHVYGRKTKTHRWVPIDEEIFLQHLHEHQARARTDYIIEFRGKQVKRLAKSFRIACKEAGIQYKVRQYDLRHHYATILANNGTPVQVISRLLGHRRCSTTMDIYMEVLPKEEFKIKGMLPMLKLPEEEPSQVQNQ